MKNEMGPPEIFKVKTFKKCPNCENGLLDIRIPRSFLVKHFFKWKGNKRYQCSTCGIKIYMRA